MNRLFRALFLTAALAGSAVMRTQAAPTAGTTSFSSPTSGGFTNLFGQPSPLSADYLGFRFIVSTAYQAGLSHASGRVNLGNGNTTPASTFNYLSVGSDDGSEFKFSGFNGRCTNGTWLGPITITGYRNGGVVPGATATHTFSGTATDNTVDFSADTDFNWVDEVRITGAGGTGIGFVSFNSITTAAGTPPPAPVVTNVTSSTPNGAYNVPDPISIQVTFDSSVTVTGTPTLALNSGGTASYASGSPSNTLTFNYTVGASQTAADLDYAATNSLGLSGGTINGTTGGSPATLTLPSPGAAGSLGANKAIIIDTTVPTINIGAPSVSTIVAGAGSVTYTVTYADTNFSGSTLNNGNITLNTTGTASATVGVSGSGLTRTVTVSSITGVGTLGISIASGTASDTAGNTAATAGPSATFAVTSPPATVQSLNGTTNGPQNGAFISWQIIFDVPVSGLSPSNFATVPTGLGGSPAVISVNPPGSSPSTTWNISVSTGTGDGTLGVNLVNDTGLSHDVTNVPFTGVVRTIDKTAPSIGIGSPSASTIAAGAGSVTYTVTYADTNFNSSTLANGNITLNTTGTANGTVNVSGSGLTRTVTVSSITGVGTLGISIASGTASDTAGNTAAAAGPSTTFTVTNVPGTPTIGTATAGTTANATVTFTAPASDGGSPITSYSVTSAPGGVVNTGATSPITVSGLTPGIVYTFRVQAFNANGPSALSAASNSITAVTVPGTPTIGTATAGNATASVAFTAPASTGGSAILDYTATSSPGGITATSATSPISVTGLTNGTPYTFTVTARNAAGSGAASSASNSVTPTAPAEVPISLTSGSLNIDAGSSPGAANTVLRFVTGPGGPFLEIFDAGRTLGVPAGGTQVDPNTVRIPIASLTGGITLTGSALADTFTLNFTDGDICPPGGIAVHGGAPTISPGDTLVLDGDFTSGGSYGTGSLGSGTLGLDTGNTVTFTGLEPVDMSAASFVDFNITVDPTAVFSGNVITTVAAVDAGVNTEVTFGSSGLESAKLGVVTGTLTINGDNLEQDYFILQGLGSAMTGHFVVDGRGGDSDVIEVNNTTFTVAGLNKNLSLKADFIGLGRLDAAPGSDNPGVINGSGGITLEANGDNTVVTPLWNTTSPVATGVWGALPTYFVVSTTPLLTHRGTIQVRGDILKTAGSDATLTLKATGTVVFPAGTVLAGLTGRAVATTNKLNVVIHSDSDSLNGGNVWIQRRGTLTTNGGNLTVGGGSDPTTSPAVGFGTSSTSGVGIFLQSSVISTSGGNIAMRGLGGGTVSPFGLVMSAFGGSVDNVLDSGSGTLTLIGTGAPGSGNSQAGVGMIGQAAQAIHVKSTTGSITINGTSQTTGTGANNSGFHLGTNADIVCSGAGNISITGSAAATPSATLGGVTLAPGSGTTAAITSAGGNITLIADTMNLSAGAGTESISTSGSGSVTLKQLSNSKNIDLGAADSSTLLAFATNELDNVTAPTLTIGDSNSGSINVSSVIAPLNFKTLALGNNTTFAATGGFTADVTGASVFEKMTVTGTVNITAGAALTMASAGGYVWNGTDTFTLLANDAADAITGTFTGPTLTNFLGSALTAQAFYNTSGGNDLILGAALSSNADLSALVVNTASFSPTFAAGTTTGYTASVSNATSSVTVTPTRAQANATIEARSNANAFASVTSGSPSGALALNLGSNTLDVRVTAQDGITIKTYTITVTRRSLIEDWRLTFFADASGTSNRANGADFDLDGKTNLLEFAFGTDPTLGSSGPPDLTMTGTYAAATFGTTGQPIVKLEPITNGVDYRAVFIRRVDHAAAGLTYTSEFSADNFTSFTAIATAPTVLATSGSYQLVSVPYPHFLSNGKKARFFRVSVSIAP